jgi:Flp pilus assembly pilin Flp
MNHLGEKMTHWLQRMLATAQMRIGTMVRAEEGQGLTEYALILVFVAIVAIVALKLLGTNITSVLNEVAGKV